MKSVLAFIFALFCTLAAWAQDDRVKVSLQTSEGEIILALYNETPLHRDNFIKKVKAGVYNGRTFNRVIAGFVVQCGEEQEEDIIPAEIHYPQFFHRRGVLAMGRCTADSTHELKSADEQFYIAWGRMNDERRLQRADSLMNVWSYGQYRMDDEVREYYKSSPGIPSLDGSYTIFGEVVKGLDIVERIQETQTDSTDRPLKDITIEKAVVLPNSSVVIVYFDSSVGRKPLEKAIKETHSEITYRYNNFNAYALKVQDASAREKIEQTKGVLSVQDDRMLELQDINNKEIHLSEVDSGSS